MTLDREETKEIIKEALREWLDEKYMTFGKWTLNGILAMAIAGATWLMFMSQGWHK